MTATVTSKGQVTIPVEARRRLRILPGTKLEFIVRDDGRLEVIPMAGSVKSLKGAVPKPKKLLTLAEMDEAVAKGARRRSGSTRTCSFVTSFRTAKNRRERRRASSNPAALPTIRGSSAWLFFASWFGCSIAGTSMAGKQLPAYCAASSQWKTYGWSGPN